MAPTQLLLEGPAIEPLLERVWAEHGPEVKIVKAERVRVGGIVGFFAREQFEVTVELDDATAGDRPRRPAAHALPADDRPALPPAPAVRPQGIEALLAAAEDAERPAPVAAAAPPVAPAAPAPPVDAGAFDSIFSAVLSGAQPAPPAGALSVRTAPPAPAPAPAQQAAAAPAPPSVADPADPPPVVVQNAPHPGVHAVVQQALVDAGLAAPGTTVLPDTELWQPVAPGSLRSEPAPAPPAPSPPAAEWDPDWSAAEPPEDPAWEALTAAAELLGTAPDEPAAPRAAELHEPHEPPAPAPRLRSFAPVPAPRPASDAVLAPAPAPAAETAEPVAEPTLGALDAPEGRRGRRAAGRRAAGSADDGAAGGEVALAERLAGLGVPAAWLWDLPASRAEALRRLAARIADAPAQSRRGTTAEAPVVAVLADLDGALPVAQRLAVGLGLDAAEVVVAGRRAPGAPKGRCLPARHDLLAEAERARLHGRSLVVVLPAPVGAAPAARAGLADTLSVLDPDEVWAVVDATRRLDDSAAWLSALAGERGVDAVALVNVEATSAPAAALGLPAPVVLVEDRPATPEVWVTTLAARLAAQDLHLAQRDAAARAGAAR